MVLSRPAVQLISGSNSCKCPRPDTPDDMWLGACAESLGIPIVHFPGFHQVSFLFFSSPRWRLHLIFLFQARPDDYPPELLQTQFVVSFHKHWMLDPVQVYEKWFAEDPAFFSQVQDVDDRSPLDPSSHCSQVKQQPELFRSESTRERLADEL